MDFCFNSLSLSLGNLFYLSVSKMSKIQQLTLGQNCLEGTITIKGVDNDLILMVSSTSTTNIQYSFSTLSFYPLQAYHGHHIVTLTAGCLSTPTIGAITLVLNYTRLDIK